MDWGLYLVLWGSELQHVQVGHTGNRVSLFSVSPYIPCPRLNDMPLEPLVGGPQILFMAGKLEWPLYSVMA